MKKFLCKSAALFLLTAMCVYLLGAAYQRTNTCRNLERANETERFSEVPRDIDIAAVGSSHGMLAFLYAPEDARLFNFCLSAQIPQYDLRMLREYGDRLSPDAVVLITVSYMTPFWTEPEETFLWKQNRYYSVLSPQNIIEPDWAKWVLGRFSPVLTTDFGTVVRAFVKPPELEPLQNEASGHLTFDPADIPKGQDQARTNHISSLISPVFPESSPEAVEALKGILDLCQERGWQAVLVTPPYLEAYNQVFSQWSEQFYPRFYQYVRELSREYNVPYLDYSHDQEFAQQYSFYKDIDHLNLDGAMALDTRLYADLKVLLGDRFPFSNRLSPTPFAAN